MTQKFLYVVDHFVGFPISEYGGIWNVIAQSDDECFNLISDYDQEENVSSYAKLRENITNAPKFELRDETQESKIVDVFLT
jgi:hypothetical protein